MKQYSIDVSHIAQVKLVRKKPGSYMRPVCDKLVHDMPPQAVKEQRSEIFRITQPIH